MAGERCDVWSAINSFSWEQVGSLIGSLRRQGHLEGGALVCGLRKHLRGEQFRQGFAPEGRVDKRWRSLLRGLLDREVCVCCLLQGNVFLVCR